MLKGNRWLLPIAFILATCILMICSQNSFLYQINEAVSINMYLTIGKEMKCGKIPYLDIVDQKGPVLFFLYELITMISESGYVAVYLTEIIALGLFLFFFAQTLSLYQRHRGLLCCAMLVMGVATCVSGSFFAGNPEELMLWLIMYMLFSVLRAIKENRLLLPIEAFMNGVGAAIVFWTKFTALGVCAGTVVFIVIKYLLDKNAGLKELIKVSGQFLLGVLVVSGFIIGYFVVNHALKDMLSIYIFGNVFRYSDGLGIVHSLHAKIADMIYYSCEAIRMNWTWTVLLLIGAIYSIACFRRSWKESALCLLGLFAQWAALYLPKNYYPYYALVLAPFAVFGFIALNEAVSKVACRHMISESTLRKSAMILSVVVAIAFLGTRSKEYYETMKYRKEDSVRYQFAEIMNKREDPTLLVYGVLDSGFYYVADISPSCKYFCKLNQRIPGMVEMQNDYVENGKTQFVITSVKPLDAYDVNSSKYEYISENQGFYLYELKQ